jgi:hypothetical protein
VAFVLAASKPPQREGKPPSAEGKSKKEKAKEEGGPRSKSFHLSERAARPHFCLFTFAF